MIGDRNARVRSYKSQGWEKEDNLVPQIDGGVTQTIGSMTRGDHAYALTLSTLENSVYCFTTLIVKNNQSIALHLTPETAS